MQEQNYKNHVRIHPPFHFVGVPLMLLTLLGSIANLFIYKFSFLSFVILVSVVVLSVTLALVRLYATKLQDRIVRVEENLRHYILTGKQLDAKLTHGQLIALRFASDEEFPVLCERAIKENLKPDDIKKSVTNWRVDFLRV